MDIDNLAVYSLVEQLRSYSRKQFTGKLELHSINQYKWNIYYCHGRLVWVAGGIHHHRRWRRLIGLHKVQIDFNKISLRTEEEVRLWDYHSLVIQMKRSILTREQITPIIEALVHESLFDIIQCAANERINYYCDFEDEITPVISLIHAENAIDRAHQDWLAWRKAGIADFSPNLAPWIKRPEQLKEEASELTYKTLITVVDGRRSLRELSVWMKRDLFVLVQSLMAYYHRGLVGLVAVPDVPSPISSFYLDESDLQDSGSRRKELDQKYKDHLEMPRPLVACVDDSKQVCSTIEHIVTELGFGFVGIRDSINVLPLLVELKPELIILDLVMPIVNGYELCTQIRRMPDFKDTPILILTSNDTFIDRIRAKLVGATSFISKTSDNDKIAEEIQKYILAPYIEIPSNSLVENSDISNLDV